MLLVLLLHRGSELRLTHLARITGRTRALGRLGDGLAVVLVFCIGVLGQHVLDVLLRQRRTALGVLGEQVVDRCTRNALQVDAAVLEEPLVLNGDRGFLHALGDVVERDLPAVLPVEGRDLRTVGREHTRLLGERTLFEFGRQGAEQLHAGIGAHRRHADGRDRQTGTDHARDDADGDELEECRNLVGG